MKILKLSLVLIFCFSTAYSFAQAQFDLLINALEADKTQVLETESPISVQNLESINSEYLEYSPTLHQGGIVFSSNRPRNNNFISKFFTHSNSNLYYTAEEGQNFYYTPIELPGKVNTSKHEGSAAFNEATNTLIYSCNCSTKNSMGIYELKLCTARFESGKWIATDDLRFSTGYRSCHPTVSAEGDIIVFSSKRPDGYGGMDLYVTTYMHGAWQEPKNLGPEINTYKDEVFPTLTNEGVLVFSSNGLAGNGGLDLFYAHPSEDFSWSAPTNMGNSFNSAQDDFGFLSFGNGTRGMFTSNRPGGKGGDDIYGWQINPTLSPDETLTTANLLLLDELTGLPLKESNITMIEINTNLLQTNQLTDELVIANEVDPALLSMLGIRLTANQSGVNGHEYDIKKGQDYFLRIEQAGYTTLQKIVGYEHLVQKEDYAILLHTDQEMSMDDIATVEEAPIEYIHSPVTEIEEPVIASMLLVDTESEKTTEEPAIPETEEQKEIFTARGIPAEYVEVEKTAAPLPANAIDNAVMTFDNIYYALNKYELTTSSKSSIDELISLMKQDESLRLTIKSHTDTRGKASFNKWLSQMRADAVKAYMISRGIAATRLKSTGMGEEVLINNCEKGQACPEEIHRKNRRTEFIFER